ncbi:MAG: hypothetical protein GYB66_10350 [Chloroflexi bacterium]|nr:hypothetical protein [Chloroflexota bacterium]
MLKPIWRWRRPYFLLLAIVIGALVASCGPAEDEPKSVEVVDTPVPATEVAAATAVPVTPRATATPVPPATHTVTVASPLPSSTATATLTPSATSTVTPTGTQTRQPTNTPTDTLVPSPTITLISGAPPPVPKLPEGDYERLNILLLGTDDQPGRPSQRTDVIIIVSVNKTTATVNMLSLPRDLYVYVPNYSYQRINSAVYLGETDGFPGGGVALLKETIHHNLGIPIHGYARVNFDGFRTIIDAVEGIDMLVDCSLSDYRLKSPDLDPTEYDNWEWTTIDAGLHHMDGETALWYARSRVTTSDFDRNRRHQILLRGIWRRFDAASMWDRIPDLWDAFSDTIDTDLTLDQILSLVPIGIQLSPDMIESHFIGPDQVEFVQSPQGGSVLVLKPAAGQDILNRFYTPPTQNRLYQESPRVEILNRTGEEYLDLVAQERLAWEGFDPFISTRDDKEPLAETMIYDYTGVTKGGSLEVFQRVLDVSSENIVFQPDPDRTVDYLIILGEAYDACTYNPWEGWEQVN